MNQETTVKNLSVSIGIPTYNRADTFLRDALESALGQTYGNIEIIVSDNGSTDNTRELVSSYNDPRIRYIYHDPPLTPFANWNFCVQQAKGDYFLLLHDDDMIDLDFVEVCVSGLNGNRVVGIVRTGIRVIDNDRNTVKTRRNNAVGLSTDEFFLSWFNNDTSIYLCNTLFNTRRLKEHDGFHSKTNLFDDVVAAVSLAAKYGRVDIADVKASFRRHDTNRGAAAQVIDWCEDSLFLLDLMCELGENRREQIRQHGLKYFAKKCYRHTSNIPSPLERIVMYLKVYRRFRYAYSPFQYLYGKKTGSFIKKLVRRRKWRSRNESMI